MRKPIDILRGNRHTLPHFRTTLRERPDIIIRRRRSNRPGNSQAKGPQGRHISGEQWRKCHSPKGVSWSPHGQWNLSG